jgi:hypothetical protein
LILSEFAEEAVVPLVPGEAVIPAAAVQPVVAMVAAQPIVRSEAVDDVVPPAANNHIPLARPVEDIWPVRPDFGRGESEALGSAPGLRGGDARRRHDHQGSDEDGKEAADTQESNTTRNEAFAPNEPL